MRGAGWPPGYAEGALDYFARLAREPELASEDVQRITGSPPAAFGPGRATTRGILPEVAFLRGTRGRQEATLSMPASEYATINVFSAVDPSRPPSLCIDCKAPSHTSAPVQGWSRRRSRWPTAPPWSATSPHGQQFVDDGTLSAANLEQFLDGIRRPGMWDVATLQISAWAQRSTG